MVINNLPIFYKKIISLNQKYNFRASYYFLSINVIIIAPLCGFYTSSARENLLKRPNNQIALT